MTESGSAADNSGLLKLDGSGRVVDVENKIREYERDFSSPEKILHTVVAFANSAGGQIIIGIADDGEVAGVADPLREEERTANLIADSIKPMLLPAIDLATLNGKTVLIIQVSLSAGRVHHMKAKGLGAGTYVRLGSTTRLADPALVLELQRTARGVRFESFPEPRAALEDLDLRMLAGLRQRKAEAAEVSVLTEPELTALGLAVSEGQKTVPTNAGILLACPDPTRFLPSAWVQVGRLRGEGETDIFDQDEIHGPILLAVGKTMEFLKKNAFQSAVFGEARRRDVYSIPVEAIREVVVNALVHASYAEQGTPIRVAFYDDRIQVESPGGCCRE